MAIKLTTKRSHNCILSLGALINLLAFLIKKKMFEHLTFITLQLVTYLLISLSHRSTWEQSVFPLTGQTKTNIEYRLDST